MKHTEHFLRTYVHWGNIVFDVGANVGQSALIAAPLCGPIGRVVSFEPNPAIFQELRAATAQFLNVTVVNKALSDRSGPAEFFVDTREGFTSNASSLYPLEDLVAMKKSERITVETTTIDEYCEAAGCEPDVLKIDVESAEPLVIVGGWCLIERRNPVMLFEFWETWWNRGFQELFERLVPLYRLSRIQDGLDVERFYHDNAASGNVDILCVPRKP
jgi:FkbM family methyltransferase